MGPLKHLCVILFIFLSSSLEIVSQETIQKELNRSISVQSELLEEVIAKGDSLYKQKIYSNAQEEYERAFSLLQNSCEDSIVKSIGFRIEHFYRNQTREYSKALNVLNFLTTYCEERNDENCVIRINNELGLLYNRMGEYIRSLEYYGDALKLAEKQNDTNFLNDIYLSRGFLLLDIGDKKQARMDFKKALEFIKRDNAEIRKGRSYLNLSATFDRNEADSILYYSRLASIGCNEDPLTRHCIMVYNNIAWGYYLKKKPKEALEIIRTNISWDNNNLTYSDNDDLYPGLMHTLGAIEYELGNYDKALDYFLISQSNFEKRKDVSDLIIVKEDLSKLYEETGDLKSSIKTLKEIKDLELLHLKIEVNKGIAKKESQNLLLEKEEVISGLEEKNLEIKKEVSKTKWVTYFLVILLFLTVLVFIYKGYRSKIEYYKINEKLTLMRLTSLRSSMNPHFLFNTFSTLQNYILKNDNLKANEYMTKLSGLIRNVLNSSDSIYIDFKTELEIIKSYVSLQRGRFQEEFDVIFEIDPGLNNTNPKIPSMIIQPFIENAIIHGFSHSPIKGELKIILEKHNNTVLCTIIDNGIGREASEKLKKNQKEVSHLSIATENTNERLEILNKTVFEKSNVIINDLKDSQGTPTGTEVIITLPIIKEITK